MKHALKGSIVLVMVVLMGLGGVALAGQGRGPDGAMMREAGCPGYGMGRDGDGHGWMGAKLTDEQKSQLEKERAAFFEETKELRRQIREKEVALDAEMIKKAPSLEAASAIQKEISGLMADLDQQRLRHHFRMKQIVPELGAMGMGRHHGGKGFGGHGRCWN